LAPGEVNPALSVDSTPFCGAGLGLLLAVSPPGALISMNAP
jgi:hypothetical protein